jgi:hypothetical protein
MSTTPQAGDPVEIAPAVVDAAAAARSHDVAMGRSTTSSGIVVPVATGAAVTPTQLRRPWRSVARTIFQATVSLAAMWGVIVQVAGLPDWAWVGCSVAVAGGVTRVMALPAVEVWLRRFFPFLAAAPRPKP